MSRGLSLNSHALVFSTFRLWMNPRSEDYNSTTIASPNRTTPGYCELFLNRGKHLKWCSASAISVGCGILKDHFPTFKHGTLRNQEHGIVTGVLFPILIQKFSEMFHIEFKFRNHTSAGCTGHCWEHCRKTRISAEYFHHKKTLM